jgi:hypothetical protein
MAQGPAAAANSSAASAYEATMDMVERMKRLIQERERKAKFSGMTPEQIAALEREQVHVFTTHRTAIT